METKNITLALDITDYEYLGTLKKQLRVKSFSQLVGNLIDFYRENRNKMAQMESNSRSSLDKLDNVETDLSSIKDKMVTQNELSYLKTNIELIKQNYDVVQSLMARLDAFQDSLVTQKEIERIYSRMQNLEKLIENVVNNTLSDTKFAKDENHEIKTLLRAKQKLKE